MSTLNNQDSPKNNILLLMSGSIACAKASGLISAWVKQGHQVRVACTNSVGEFLGPATIEGLSGHPVLSDVFTSGQVMDHIHLARWADMVVAAPATSNLINKLAAGIADDAVTCLWQAAYGREKPMFIVPAMNTHMWNYPATAESVNRLQSWGVQVLPTATGDLACGEQGAGRLLEPEDILQRINRFFTARVHGKGKRILITAGGTQEPIDSVRYIGNRSSGRTSAALADALSIDGHQLTWLGAQSAVRPLHASQLETYTSFDDLAAKLQNLLGEQHFDVVIHAAAVSDYSVDRLEQNGLLVGDLKKKVSSKGNINLHLKTNPKLLNKLRDWSLNPETWIIGFKLTHGAGDDERILAIKRLFDDASVNAVVHNDLAEIESGCHRFSLHTSTNTAYSCSDSDALANCINQLIA